MEKELARQIEILSSGVLEVLPVDGLKTKAAKSLKERRPLIVKLGVDPTAPDLHLGHAVPLRKLRQFQDLGHKAVLIIGDFTALVGDPSGRSATRPSLTPDQVKANAKTYTDQAFKILDDRADRLELRYNSDWLKQLDFAAVLELTARFTVAGLLVRDDFMKRYQSEQPIGLHEFLYPVMQAYDSVEIKADIELGGSDQKFNLLAGRELQEKFGLEPQVALTLPLLEGTDGARKMSKSYNNHIGLTFEASDMFGKVMSISDGMMENYYTLLTDIPTERIAVLTSSNKTHPKEAKVLLGKTIVAQFHGLQAGEAAAAEFEKVFAQGQLPEDIPEVALPAVPISVKNLLTACKLVDTGGEAKRMVQQGGVSIDGRKAADPNAEIAPRDGMIVQVGKRRFAKLRVQ